MLKAMSKAMSRAKANRGFSLIEALIAMLLFAIGFLAIASLQLRGIQAAKISFQRSAVVNAASDLADRIIANRAALAINRLAYKYDSSNYTSSGIVNCYAKDTSCTTAQLATKHIYDMQEYISSTDGLGLNNYKVKICFDDTISSTPTYASCDDNHETLVVKVQWDNLHADQLDANESAASNTNLVYLPVLTQARGTMAP